VVLRPDQIAQAAGLPEWCTHAYRELRETLLSTQRPFPCTFAVEAMEKGHLRFVFLGDPGQPDVLAQLVTALGTYALTYRQIARFTSLIAVFASAGHRPIAEYRRLFWQVLRYLHRNDPSPWPSWIPSETDDPLWEFSFRGEPWFVVCTTPAHKSRRSRSSSYFTITFQPREVFLGLDARTPAGDAARKTIRERLRAYDAVAPSLRLGAYGDCRHREWQQYFLPDQDDEKEERCPFG
jgi:FPC/CPF motif-containing protein YcgG